MRARLHNNAWRVVTLEGKEGCGEGQGKEVSTVNPW